MTRRTFVGLVALAAAGCGVGGQARYQLSGAVTYAGSAVPAGEVQFEPDAAKGNSGPGSVARIKDGRYQTAPGKGVVGGAYIVRVVPFDGRPSGESLDGKPLLKTPYETHVEFPLADHSQDFDVPPPVRK